MQQGVRIMFPPITLGTLAQAPSADTRYLRDDLNKSLKPEQRALWERHYPVGQLLPVFGLGLTVAELVERVHWYCKVTQAKMVGGVDEALVELRSWGLVKVAKEKKE